MTDTQSFALIVLLVAAVGLVAVLSSRLTERVKIPSPALVLAGAAIAVQVIPALHAPPRLAVERVVTVALVCILFDGGMQIGWSRFRSAAAPIVSTGVIGTFLTAGATAAFVHLAFGLSWYLALLLATAVAPTDPAVVFSVLGQQEVSGRSGTILEGESGANDPVGIALMASLISAGGLSLHAFAGVGGEFLLQMFVGAAIGAAGGAALGWFTRRVPLPSEGLYPLRTLACALLIFGVATLARGSGFLAVFVAGIALGDGRAPFKREIERFHTALASLAEIVAFVALGLTVSLSVIARADVWVPGIILGAVLAFVVRPVLVGLSLLPARLSGNERGFVLFAGLKGAVPILLGIFLLEAHVADGARLYGIIAVVVAFSVVVQGSLVPWAARVLRVPMRSVEPQPWALGVRLRDEPSGVHRLTINAGSAADGRTIGEIAGLPGDAWVSFVVRDGQLVPIKDDVRLRPGDDVLVLADPGLRDELVTAFEGRLPEPRLPGRKQECGQDESRGRRQPGQPPGQQQRAAEGDQVRVHHPGQPRGGEAGVALDREPLGPGDLRLTDRLPEELHDEADAILIAAVRAGLDLEDLLALGQAMYGKSGRGRRGSGHRPGRCQPGEQAGSGCSGDGSEPVPPAGRGRAALERAVIGKAVDLLSGPDGLASFLRRRPARAG